jgi:hypothetical protein
MARIHPPTVEATKRAAAPGRPNVIIDQPAFSRANRSFHEDAVEARDPAGDFGGGEITQSVKALAERLTGLSNGLTVLAQRIDPVARPEPPATVEKDTGGPGASSAVARALQHLDRGVESMQVRIDSLTERIVL